MTDGERRRHRAVVGCGHRRAATIAEAPSGSWGRRVQRRRPSDMENVPFGILTNSATSGGILSITYLSYCSSGTKNRDTYCSPAGLNRMNNVSRAGLIRLL